MVVLYCTVQYCAMCIQGLQWVMRDVRNLNSGICILDSGILRIINHSRVWSTFDQRSWTSGLWPVLTLPEMLVCHG